MYMNQNEKATKPQVTDKDLQKMAAEIDSRIQPEADSTSPKQSDCYDEDTLRKLQNQEKIRYDGGKTNNSDYNKKNISDVTDKIKINLKEVEQKDFLLETKNIMEKENLLKLTDNDFDNLRKLILDSLRLKSEKENLECINIIIEICKLDDIRKTQFYWMLGKFIREKQSRVDFTSGHFLKYAVDFRREYKPKILQIVEIWERPDGKTYEKVKKTFV